jgi:hypothetical protein
MRSEVQRWARSLDRLRLHWDGIYDISATDGVWAARLKADPTAILTCASSGELRAAMQEDYAARADRSTQIGEGGSL